MNVPISVRLGSTLAGITFDSIKPICLYKYHAILSYLKHDQKAILDKWRFPYSIPKESYIPKIIWVMWWSGDLSKIPIVQKSLERIREFALSEEYDFRLITEHNVHDFIDVSDLILLLKERKITIQCLSDAVRFRLLWRYGGFWMDATLLLNQSISSSKMNEIQQDLKFFSINLIDYPKWRSVSCGRITSFFWGTFPCNPFFGFLDDIFNRFLIDHEHSIDYFMNDYMIRIAYDELEYARNMIDGLKPSNPEIYFLMTRLNKKYDPRCFEVIMRNTWIFKLNWRINVEDSGEMTYWKAIKQGLI